jgi:hypothetical protein
LDTFIDAQTLSIPLALTCTFARWFGSAIGYLEPLSSWYFLVMYSTA